MAPAVVFAAELQQGVGLRAVMTFGIALGPLLVVIASFATSTTYWKLGTLDWVCGGLSGLALATWAIKEFADVAIILSIASDATLDHCGLGFFPSTSSSPWAAARSAGQELVPATQLDGGLST